MLICFTNRTHRCMEFVQHLFAVRVLFLEHVDTMMESMREALHSTCTAAGTNVKTPGNLSPQSTRAYLMKGDESPGKKHQPGWAGEH